MRTKEELEMYFAKSREKYAKIREKEKMIRQRKKLEKIKSPNVWVRNFLEYSKEYPEWRLDFYSEMEFSMHSVDVLNVLCNKEELDENEEEMLNLALRYAYPNEFDD